MGVALSLVATACGGRAEPPRDVLLVTIDTLRADFLGCYGSPFDLTPRLDALAREGVLLERHYTTAVHTGPAHLTLLTGLAPEEHGVVRNGQESPADVLRLSEAFGAAGYRTAAVIGSAVLSSKFGFDQGFEVFDEDLASQSGGTAPKIQHQRTAEEVVARALEVLSAEDERPLFLWVHLYDVHGPFVWPIPPALAEAGLAELLPELGPLDDGHRAPATPDEALELARGYGAAVKYVDDAMVDLLAGWERERGPRGVVAVTSDHGEGLWEHGYDGHGLLLYEEAVQVPMLLYAPGHLPADTRVRGITSNVDVPRMLLVLAGADSSALGVRLPGGDGLAARLADPSAEGGEAFHHRRLLLASMGEAIEDVEATFERLGTDAGEKIGFVHGDWKVIGDPHGELALYDLRADPAETEDVAQQNSDVLAKMRARMLQREARLERRDGRSVTDEATRSMLDALGY